MIDAHVETFIEVAEQGSFARAAEKAFVSRTALIQQINLLENRLGFTLFNRSNRGVTLTPAGQLYLKECKRAQVSFARTIDACRAMRAAEAVRVGMLPNFPSIALPQVIRAYHKAYPKRRVEFVECPSADYFKLFRQEKFDVAVEYMAPFFYNNPNYCILELTKTRHCLGIPRGNILASRMKLSLDDLKGQKILLYRRGVSAVDDMLRDQFRKHSRAIALQDVDSYASSLAIECEVTGALLVFYEGYQSNYPSLRKVALKLDEEIPITLGFGYHKNAPAHVIDFIDIARQSFDTSKSFGKE